MLKETFHKVLQGNTEHQSETSKRDIHESNNTMMLFYIAEDLPHHNILSDLNTVSLFCRDRNVNKLPFIAYADNLTSKLPRLFR